MWAKCDMVAVVSTERLDLIRSGKRRADGKREYLTLQIGREQFEAICHGVVAGLGLTSVFSRPDAAASMQAADSEGVTMIRVTEKAGEALTFKPSDLT